MRIFLVFILFFNVLPVWSKSHKICGSIKAMDGELKLNDNERVLVCGRHHTTEGWEDVPLTQAQFHLKTILQNLGYMDPRFERKSVGDDVRETELQVWLGHRTKIKSLVIEGDQAALDPAQKRKVIHEALTATKLNEIEDWARVQTQSKGFACGENTLSAQAWDGKVTILSELHGRKKFGALKVSDLGGLDLDVLDRYQPFEEGEWYDIRKTQIMTSRLLDDGLFQSAYFVVHCEGDIAQLNLESSVGKPRILRFGIGASTEEFPFIDLSFRNARLDDKASSYTTSFHASPRKVSLTGTSELYVLPGWTRTFLGPRFEIAKEMETSFETNTAKAGVDIGRNWDLWDLRFNGRWGPTLNYTKTVRGIGPADVTYPTIDGSLLVKSHLYEYLVHEQYEGWLLQFIYRGQNKGLGSQLDMNRYQTELKNLWNLGGFSPPLFVLGARLQNIVVDAQSINRDQNRDLLPIEDRIYLGGDQNLRGFPRQSIDNNDLGYLTSLYLGFELRLIEELPYRLQPFLLWDAAQVGNRRYALEKPLFISEGLGLRWASPFGTLRGSYARGRIWNGNETTKDYPQEWVLFLSFGQEF